MGLDFTALHFLVSSWIPSRKCFRIFFTSFIEFSKKVRPKLPIWGGRGAKSSPLLHNWLYLRLWDSRKPSFTFHTCYLQFCMCFYSHQIQKQIKPLLHTDSISSHLVALIYFIVFVCKQNLPFFWSLTMYMFHCVYIERGTCTCRLRLSSGMRFEI